MGAQGGSHAHRKRHALCRCVPLYGQQSRWSATHPG